MKLVSRGQIAAAQRFQQEVSGDPIRVTDETFSPEQYRLDAEQRRNRRDQLPVPILSLFDGYVQKR